MDTPKNIFDIIFTLFDKFGSPFDEVGEMRCVSYSCYDDHLITGKLTLAKAVTALRKDMGKHGLVIGRDLWIGEIWADYGSENSFLSLDLLSPKITRK